MQTNFFGDKIPEFTVTQFANFVDQVLGQMTVYVTGEISGYKLVQNKWVTFELKDENSRISCFGAAFQLGKAFEDGMKIKVKGKPGLYTPYGKFTLRMQTIELLGEGALQRAYEMLKSSLTKEGIFDDRHKKELPRFPQKIGLVTSKEAAAFTDITRILQNRWAGLSIYLYPVLVQGADAPESIVEAIQWFNQYHPVDVLLVTRGGGSLEDLQAFNSEKVVRSIFASRIPVVVGVGHERDITLADFVADIRASTPSNAAELVVPDKQEILPLLGGMEDDLLSNIEQHLFELDDRLVRSGERMTNFFTSITNHVEQKQQALLTALTHLDTQMSYMTDKLLLQEKMLQQSHPHTALQKGYSITRDANGILIRSKNEAVSGKLIVTEVADGKIESVVS